jgi:hypothetical protein
MKAYFLILYCYSVPDKAEALGEIKGELRSLSAQSWTVMDDDGQEEIAGHLETDCERLLRRIASHEMPLTWGTPPVRARPKTCIGS